MKNIAAILHSAVLISTPLLYAATGALYTELAGMLNIALEGMLLTGAFAAVAAVFITGNIAAGIMAAVIASAVLALLTAFAALKLKSNVFIAGLAANLLAGGLTAVMSQHLFKTRGVVPLRDFSGLGIVDIPVIRNAGILGSLLSGFSLYTYGAWLVLFLSWLIIRKTPFGYRLRACGMHPEVLRSLGINSDIYRYAAFLFSGFFCGLGGSFLSLNLGAYIPNMPAGRGWIALVIMLLARRRPLGILVAAFVYGLAEAFSNYAQGIINFPAELILAMPYVITLLAITGASLFTARKAHAEKAPRFAPH
jgi:simple sugar transport system permease protein